MDTNKFWVPKPGENVTIRFLPSPSSDKTTWVDANRFLFHQKQPRTCIVCDLEYSRKRSAILDACAREL